MRFQRMRGMISAVYFNGHSGYCVVSGPEGGERGLGRPGGGAMQVSPQGGWRCSPQRTVLFTGSVCSCRAGGHTFIIAH